MKRKSRNTSKRKTNEQEFLTEQMTAEEHQGVKRKKRDSNREFAVITYCFIGIFVAMIAYFTYFQVVRSEDFINHPYNTRLDSFASRITRGTIVSSDGEILATTRTDDDGHETRKYPHGRMYAHVVGYAENGKAGLESAYNFELLRSHTFILERVLNEIEGKKNPGDTLVTTLNHELQEAAYQALGKQKGAVVVIEPKTGKIRALVSKPDFDPNTIVADWNDLIEDDKQNAVLLNRVSQGLYPPGSTFKLMTALAYIREHPQDYKEYQYTCDGSISTGDYVLHCFGNKAHGTEDLEKSLAKSCNSSFAQIGLSLDKKDYERTCEELLFNQALPTDLPSSKSSFQLEKSASDDIVMSTAIGQGDTLVSPLHMALLAASIQNEGILMRPYLTERVETIAGSEVQAYEPSAYGRLMTKKEAKTLQTMMRAVVTEGTASSLNTDAYRAYGKTGSAEFGTTKGESHAWFVGFAQTEEKEALAIAVIVEGAGSGSTVGVPIAKSVFDTYFK